MTSRLRTTTTSDTHFLSTTFIAYHHGTNTLITLPSSSAVASVVNLQFLAGLAAIEYLYTTAVI